MDCVHLLRAARRAMAIFLLVNIRQKGWNPEAREGNMRPDHQASGHAERG